MGADHNLPRPLSTFVGRGRELAEIKALLTESPLLTVTGCTGIGKSRLALETATRLLPAYSGGAWFVELSPVAEPHLVAHAAASALGVGEACGQSVADILTAHLGDRRALLVLDNCEHVLAGCAELTMTLLRSCRGLTVLATSQEPLGIPGERVWQAPPLALPAPGDRSALEESEAIRLFCERARSQSKSFSLTDDTAADVAEICRRLDGNPLAIELAAARAATMGPTAVLRRLAQRFRLLTSDTAAAPARHRTLEAAIAWSFDLLSEPQRVLLRRLSVFEGQITLEAAEQVCADEDLPVDDLCPLLAGLVERSLVVAEVAGRQARYRLLESIGHFARERLDESGEWESVWRRFVDWCGALVEQAEPELVGPTQQSWRARLEAEHDNVVAAIEGSLSGWPERALRIAGAMATFWRLGSHSREGLDLLEGCLAAAGSEADALLTAKAAWGAGLLAAMLGDLVTAQARAEESLRAAEEATDDRARARALTLLGAVTMYRGGPIAAADLLEQSVAMARRAQEVRSLSEALDRCGQAHMLHGDPRRAVPLFDEALELARGIGDRQAEASALIGRGWAAMELGDDETGEARIRLAEDLGRSLRDRFRTGETLIFLGELTRRRGDLEEAEARFRECRQLAQALRAPLLEARSLGGLGRVTLARRQCRAARVHFDQGLAIARQVGLPYVQTRMLLGSVACAQATGDRVSAEAALTEALDIARRNDDSQGTATALYASAAMARDYGDLERAGALHAEALQLHVDAGDTEAMVRSLEGLAGIALDQDRFMFAARLFGAADAALQDLRCRFCRWPREQQRHDRDLTRLGEALGEETLRRAWQEGANRPLEKAVAAALRASVGKRRSGNSRGALTDAELEVARLVVQGLTSREVAHRLFVSPRTVDAHLGRIYRKLDISSRQQLRDVAEHRPEFQSVDA